MKDFIFIDTTADITFSDMNVKTISATAEESAAASQELSTQAEKLDGLVTKFKLKD